MGRWFFKAILLLLVTMCLAIVTAWVTSYWREDRILVSRDGLCFQAISTGGRVRFFVLHEFPTPLPWIWEHGDDGRTPGRRVARPAGPVTEGGTVEFFPMPRHESGFGPVTIKDGLASADPWRKEAMKRLSGMPQYVSPRNRLSQTLAAPPMNLSNVEIERLIKSPDSKFRSPDLSLTRSPPNRSEVQNPGTIEVPPANDFSLSPVIRPNGAESRIGMKSAGGPSVYASATGVTGGAVDWTNTVTFSTHPRYAFDEVGIAYWLLLIAPLSPLVVRLAVGHRRRRVRRNRELRGLCIACGYDMRKTPGICPECGIEKLPPNQPIAPHAGIEASGDDPD